MEEPRHIANRVTQLESHQLDKELHDMIENVIEQLEIPLYSEELKSILKIYLYYNYVRTNSTPGMRVYNMNYCDINKSSSNGNPPDPSRYKLVMLAAINIIGPYTTRRSRLIKNLMNHYRISDPLKLSWVNLDNASLILKTLNVFNFLAFLRQGKYLTVPERILGITSTLLNKDYPTNVQLNRIQMDYMYRETVWRVLSEFLTTVLPMINLEKVKNQVSKLTSAVPNLKSEISISEKLQRESNSKKCAICLKQPFNPYVIGCRHVFCYYCLQSKYLSDPSNGYVCLACEFKTLDHDNLQRYKLLGYPQ